MLSARAETSRTGDRASLRTVFLAILATAAASWFLHATVDVTMPVALGFILALLLYPIQREVAARVPSKFWWLGVVAAVLTLLLILAAVGGFLWFSAAQVEKVAPDFEKVYSELQSWIEQTGVSLPAFSGDSQSQSQPGGEQTPAGDFVRQLGSSMFGLLGQVSRVLALATLVFFFTLLMLIEAKEWRARLAQVAGEHRALALDAVDATAIKVREYLWVRTIVSVISGALAGIWFLVIGVELWYLWGFLFFALNYIPFVGSLLAGVPPIVLAMATGGWKTALLALAGVLVMENVIGNFIDPKLEGDRLSVSPVVLLASTAFLYWAWGWPGMFLAVPLTATLVVAFAHVKSLEPVALLLSTSRNTRELEEKTYAENGALARPT